MDCIQLNRFRSSICLYGDGPEGRPDDRIRPVATFTAEVLQVCDVPAGDSDRVELFGANRMLDDPAAAGRHHRL